MPSQLLAFSAAAAGSLKGMCLDSREKDNRRPTQFEALFHMCHACQEKVPVTKGAARFLAPLDGAAFVWHVTIALISCIGLASTFAGSSDRYHWFAIGICSTCESHRETVDAGSTANTRCFFLDLEAVCQSDVKHIRGSLNPFESGSLSPKA